MYKSEINRYQQHNKVLKTQIKSLQDEQKKFRNCIGLLKSNLKDELISVPQNKLEIPLTIALKRRIKNLRTKITIVDTEIQSSNRNLDKKWQGRQELIDKLQRKLRNFILNIEFRKSVMENQDQRPPEDLETITSDQESVSENLYSEFEIKCNKIRGAQAFSVDTLSRLQYAPMLLKEKRKIVKQLQLREESQTKELELLKDELGISSEKEVEEIVGDQNGIEANKRRQKNLKNNIDRVNKENDELMRHIELEKGDIKKIEQTSTELKIQMMNERLSEEKKREELIRKIDASKKRLRAMKMQRRIQQEQMEKSMQQNATSALSAQDESSSSSLHLQLEEDKEEFPKLPTVQLKDIEDINLRISLDLRHRKVTMDQVLEALANQSYGDMQISIANTKQFFREHPISLQNEKEIEMLSRYLIEDNDEPMVEFNEELSLSIHVVKSILRNILGSYTIYNEEEAERIREQIRDYFSDKMYALQDSIERLETELQRKHCSVYELKEQFRQYDIRLVQDHWDQLILDLYNESQDKENLPLELVLKIYYVADTDEE